MYIYVMEIEHKVREIGNSLVVTIPKQVIRELKLKVNDSVLIDLKNDSIVIRKK